MIYRMRVTQHLDMMENNSKDSSRLPLRVRGADGISRLHAAVHVLPAADERCRLVETVVRTMVKNHGCVRGHMLGSRTRHLRTHGHRSARCDDETKDLRPEVVNKVDFDVSTSITKRVS